MAGDAQKKSGKGAKGQVGSSGGDVDFKRKGKKAPKQGQVKLRAQREAAKATAKKEKWVQEIEAQPSNEPSAVAMAASNAASSAAATVTRARQLIGKRPNQEQLASGMVKLAVAVCVSTIISLGVAVGVFYGLDAVHQSVVFSFQSPKTFWGLFYSNFCRIVCSHDPQGEFRQQSARGGASPIGTASAGVDPQADEEPRPFQTVRIDAVLHRGG